MSFNEKPSEKKITVTVAANEADMGMIDEPKVARQKIDITHGRHRTFVVMTSILLFLFHTPFLSVFIIFIVQKSDTNAYLFSYFRQNQNVYWAYAIAACVLFFVILIAPTVYPKMTRGALGIPLYALLWVCSFFMIMFGFTNQTQGKDKYDSADTLLTFACIFYNASLGLVVTAFFSIRSVPKIIGLCITLGGFLISVLLIWFYANLFAKPMWEYLLYSLFATGVSLYYSYDLELMVKKRGSEYSTTDWFNGFIHIQTDFTFRIWKDLFFSKPRINEEIIAELSASEPESRMESQIQMQSYEVK